MMCMKVDLPEPDGPVTDEELAARHVEIDAAQRLHLVLADHVGLTRFLVAMTVGVSAAPRCLVLVATATAASRTAAPAGPAAQASADCRRRRRRRDARRCPDR